jgi:hypothetical protein
MSQPVKLSDSLVSDARIAGESLQRSIAGQVEFWARIGRAIEPLIRGDQAICIAQQGAKPLSECLASVGTAEGMGRLEKHLNSLPFPHYEPDAHAQGLLIRINADGKRVRGRFVNGRFVPTKAR